jgi:hypothetical protein
MQIIPISGLKAVFLSLIIIACTGQDESVVTPTDENQINKDGYVVLSTEVGPWAGDIHAATLPDTLFVDYVRVYKNLGSAE